jgi:4-hydroxyphenylpyruvate dioxygenase
MSVISARADEPTRPAAPVDYVEAWDHLELWVGNARAFAAFLSSAFGFDVTAYAGPETGVRDRVSYLLELGDIRLVATGALFPDTPVSEHVRRHGDGVHDLAIAVSSASGAYRAAVARGAVGLRPPWTEEDDAGKVTRATICVYGDTRHTFVERSPYSGLFLPGYTADDLPPRPVGPDVPLTRLDHVVANVPEGALEHWVDFYRSTMGFDQLVHFDDEQISTEYSALRSTVVWDGAGVILPINEPAQGRKKSQIQEYLDYYGGAGVQHLALQTDDIVAAVAAMQARGVRFMTVPATYYEGIAARMGDLDLPWGRLQDLGLLVDRDQDGYLLQIFTETVTDRPTVFFEIIQRVGARGFGAGNFKALFEAIEQAQGRRGNL